MIDQPFYEEKFGHIIPGRSYSYAYDSDRWSFCSFISQGEEYNPGNDDCYYLPSAVSLNEQLTSPAEYLLYPNPASTYFPIGNNDDFKFEKIRIYDLSGNVVKVVKQLTDKILVSDLLAGMYIVETKVDEQLIYEKLLVE